MNQPERPNLDPVISDRLGVTRRLRQMDRQLNSEWLEDCLRNGLARKANTSILHGNTYPGSVMHYESLARLREVSILSGWGIGSTRNFETAVNADRSMAIAIAGGDAYTGNPDR